MRSGQYKLAGAGSREVNEGVTLGQFRSSTCDLAGSEGDFPHMNSLVVVRDKLSDRTGTGTRNRMGDLRHNKSCENLTTRVRSLLTRPRPAPPQDTWQYGHVVTLPRRPRPGPVMPHSGCDTASCLSASSGYSSSASSNYGSFKSSSSSNCSTLPRPAPPSPSPSPRPATLVDNPMYDVTPGGTIYDETPGSNMYDETANSPQEPLYDTIPAVRLLLTPDSGTHGGPDSLDSLDPPDSLEPPEEPPMDPPEDHVARQCREYFEQRLKNSESLKKRWSMCSSDSGADSGDGDVTTNTPPHSLPTTPPTPVPPATAPKTTLDQKMDFLRKEIASLMKQDNALFQQLLTLHQSISALKAAPPLTHSTFRPPSPASLDSFTEEEDEDEDEEDDDEQVEVSGVGVSGGGEARVQDRRKRVVDAGVLSEVDEGLDTDHHSTSTSPTSTLSSNSSYNSFSRSASSKIMSMRSDQTTRVATYSHPVNTNRPHPNTYRHSMDTKEDHANTHPHPNILCHTSTSQIHNYVTQFNNPRHKSNIAIRPSQNDTINITNTSCSNTSASATNSTVSNKIPRRYSITTTDDFNVNISINNEEARPSSQGSSNNFSTGLSTSHLSKSSCYLSQTEDEVMTVKQGLGESLGDFCSARSASYLSGAQEEELNAIKLQSGNLESSFLSKSTCYLSHINDESNVNGTVTNAMSQSTYYPSQTEDKKSNINKMLSGSLGSFCLEDGGPDRYLSRTRVSIPPSSRNRDRSVRPESFRVSSDMATHTRVLLKTRSFTGTSLRESPKKTGGRSFMRTSLRENQLNYDREAKIYQHSKRDILQSKFTNSCIVPSSDCVTINTRPELCEEETLKLRETTPKESVNISINGVERTSPKTTQVMILNSSISEEQLGSLNSWVTVSKSEPPTPNSGIKPYSVIPHNGYFKNDSENTEHESRFPSISPYLYPSNIKQYERDSGKNNQYQTRLTITDSCCERENLQETQRSSKLRAKSFTGIVSSNNPAGINTTQLLETVDHPKQDQRGTKSFKVTQEDKMLLHSSAISRRARWAREVRGTRFSSDLGFGVKPKSKKEVFV